MRHVKSIIRVNLLPANWGEANFQKLHASLVGAAIGIAGWDIKGENDLITIFPVDAMQKGIGTEIYTEVWVDGLNDIIESNIASSLGAVVKGYFPGAYVQCRVFSFDTTRGFARFD